MSRVQLSRWIASIGYAGIWILIPLWYAWLAPSTHFSVAMSLGFLMTPLVFPLRGIIAGKPYTFVWSSYISLIYFMHGIGETYSEPDQRLYGSLEILLSLMWFTGAIFYARFYNRDRQTT